MDWYVLAPAAATRDLWVSLAGPTAPEYGVWTAPSGKALHEALATEGPPGVHDVEWYFMPQREHYGKRLVDALWQGGDGLKVYSERMCAVLESCSARLQTWPADIRHRNGSPVDGYLSVLEEVDSPGPVHSVFRGRRVGRVTISGEVRTALLHAGMTGLDIREAPSAFPRDNHWV
ncbi:hypothetical protein EUA06_03685 [Nocardioides glacieisoli]|uniref:Uncharacterized protein n=1 Tax=Nocardioides glacieisoli TaxID=1168730 RepID=A0A4Q2S8F1_9ACTN|nr:hypothetical protein [Nocardioides glacieisoli]RYB96673.1 hypothetical protein EUA06_03685 [Nocardioides glacieisoli]